MTILINYIQRTMTKMEMNLSDYYWLEALEIMGLVTIMGGIIYGL